MADWNDVMQAQRETDALAADAQDHQDRMSHGDRCIMKSNLAVAASIRELAVYLDYTLVMIAKSNR